MKKEIKKSEINKLNKISCIYTVLLILVVVLIVPFLVLMDWYGLIPWGILYAVTLYFALKVEKIKKDNDLSTYKEIVAFTQGKRLDEMEKQQEIGKRPYQTVLYVIGSAALTVIVVSLMAKIFLL